jgi:predicted small lipoprotein YifL
VRRVLSFVAALATVVLFAACGEKPQTATKKSDAKASTGSVDDKYTAAGWTKGDQTTWETQLKTRAQQGQNEYARVIPTAASATK